jgi:hypothetical protein
LLSYELGLASIEQYAARLALLMYFVAYPWILLTSDLSRPTGLGLGQSRTFIENYQEEVVPSA